MDTRITLDSLLPPEIAVKAEQTGVKKAGMGVVQTFALAILAGAFIALGAMFATTVTAGSTLPYGLTKLLGGLAFSLGLILVVVAGAELFTGNNLIVMAWAGRKVSTLSLLRNWTIVWVGNFVGSLGTVAIMLATRQYEFGGGAIGAVALSTADAKAGLGFLQAVALGVMCNALVCLAIWMTYSARTTTGRMLVIIPPITAFVAAGFEHSVANMYFIPMGLSIKATAPETFWTGIQGTTADYADLTWGNFFVNNLIPVTIGNIIGGALLVGAAYWFVYLRRRPGSKPAE